MDVQLPDGTILKDIPEGTTRDEIVNKLKSSGHAVPADWLEKPSLAERAVKKVVDSQVGQLETAGALVSGAVATPIAGLAGIAQGASNVVGEKTGLWKPGIPAADRVNQVQSGLTYHPQTETGKKYTRAVGEAASYLGQKEGEAVGGFATDVATKLGASPEVAGAIGATADTALQAGSQILLTKGVGAVGKALSAGAKGATAAVPAAQAAEAYARSLGIDWAKAPQTFKDALTNIAEKGTDLKSLPAEAVKRQARAEGQGVTLTRGQATRDLGDLQSEEIVRLTKSGEPVRKRIGGQDTQLHERLSKLRQEAAPSSKITSTADVGTVQLAARRKLQAMKADANDAYSQAEKEGAFKEPVESKPLSTWLESKTVYQRSLPWLKGAIEDYGKKGKVTIGDMEDLRAELAAEAEKGGRSGFAAGRAKAVIDGILDKAQSNVYQAARGKWRAYKSEFEGQRSIRDLTSEVAGTTTRRVALEQTLQRVINGSTEALGEVKKSLTTGGTESTRRLGKKAWADLQAGVIEHLREAAAGRRRVPNEDQALHFNAAFLDEFEKLNQSGKLDVLYGKDLANKMREFADTVRDTRTSPQQRITGPSTANKFVKLMEDVGGFVLKLPGIKQAKETISERRATTRAMETPVEKAGKPKSEVSEREKKLRKAIPPAAGLTIMIRKGSEAYPQTYQGDQ